MGVAPTEPAIPRQTEASVALDRRARLAIFGATLLAMFLAAFDQTVVSTALPRIGGRYLEALFRFYVATRYLAISQY